MAKKKFQLGFSSEIKVPQLGSARLGSSRKIPARAHHYQAAKILNSSKNAHVGAA
jgi:hypothetical protein